MSQVLSRKMKKSLSNQDILRLTGGKTNLLLYPQLRDYDNLDDVLGPHKACVILYETKNGYGHWCLVMQTGKNKLEFFDPYAFKPDAELNFIPEYYREESGQDYPHLCYLMHKHGGRVEYNSDKLQRMAQDVSTCGRHVACRINFRDIPLKQYVKRLKSNGGQLSPDEIVTVLTSNV